jgi:serine protease Do
MYMAYRPMMPPLDRKASGTGFIVDIQRGLVLTNAHVCSNAISISGRMTRFGENDLSLHLVSICKEKDIALCQLVPEDIARILEGKNPEDINMKFGDNLLLKETSPVVAVGYPLGQKNIKFTTGVVSGFHSNVDGDEDEDGNELTEEEDPSYVQITAPINPGNSGGPLINRRGEIVGVNAAGYLFSQNVAYAIGSRTVVGIYDALVSPLTDTGITRPHRVITPKYAFEYNRASPDLLEITCQRHGMQGIYVKRVYPNSCFDTLKEGDVISEIRYHDIYFENPASFDVVHRTPVQGTPTSATVDMFGDVSIKIHCDTEATSPNIPQCRKMAFKEVFDMLPINTEVTLIICRLVEGEVCAPEDKQCGVYAIKSRFQFVPSTIRYPVYPRLTPYKYETVAGITISELTLGHISEADLLPYAEGKKRYEPALVVTQVLPETTAAKVRVFKEGTIIAEVNDTPVKTVEQLRAVLKDSSKYISIVGKDRDKFVISKELATTENAAAMKLFELKGRDDDE